MNQVRVALFDLDDTLFRHSDAVDRGVTAHLTQLGLGPTAADLPRWVELEERHYHRYLAGELELWPMRRARVREFTEPYGIDLTDDTHADDWYRAYFRHYERSWSLYDDAVPCLESLEPVRIGVITNADLAFQVEKIAAMGITHLIEHVISSGEVGVAKPDARIFVEAASRFDVSIENCVYVGDRLHTDAVGATEAGMLGIWLDRNGASPDHITEAAERGIPRISSLDQLAALL